jgi:hypothetical protein
VKLTPGRIALTFIVFFVGGLAVTLWGGFDKDTLAMVARIGGIVGSVLVTIFFVSVRRSIHKARLADGRDG